MHTRFWWGNLRGKSSLGRSSRRWEGNITIYLKYIGWESVEWIDLARDRDRWRTVMKTIMKLGGFVKCEEFFD